MSDEKRDLIWLIVVLLLFVVLVGVLPMLMWGLWGGYVPGMMGMMGFWWGGGFMFLIPMIFLVLIALGAYYLITEFTKPNRPVPSHGERALEILKERYAR